MPASRPAAGPGNAWIGGNMPATRLGLIINLLVPLALLIRDAMHHVLGADPVNFATHTTGLIALIYLLLSLCVTPLRTVTGWTWLIQFRRSLGVYAFYYACAHLAIYFWWTEQRDISSTVYEITHRYYLTIGFLCLALMLPLWATSFNSAIRAMGGKYWKRLHRLAYLAAILGCIHFYLQSKADKRRPEIFIGVLAALLVWRAAAAIARRVRNPVKSSTAVVSAPTAKAKFWKGEVRVVGIFVETPTVRTFRLRPLDDGPISFAFRAGQFLSLSVMIDGKRVSRSYTIASAPTRDYLEITIKREGQGRVSRFLHDQLKINQTLMISAPGGRFTFDHATAASILMIAGGVGVTPLMSILRNLTDLCWTGQIDLVFSVRNAAEIIFADELKYLSARNPNMHVHVTITGETPSDWNGHRGRIAAALLERLVPDYLSRPTFICGPDAMAQATRALLISAGASASQITIESFTPSAAPSVADAASPSGDPIDAVGTKVRFAKSDKEVSVSRAQSILEGAESIGVHIDYDCRSGICGQCRCKLLSGKVTMTMRDALSDSDESDGFILACQAHPVGDCTVDA